MIITKTYYFPVFIIYILHNYIIIKRERQKTIPTFLGTMLTSEIGDYHRARFCRF